MAGRAPLRARHVRSGRGSRLRGRSTSSALAAQLAALGWTPLTVDPAADNAAAMRAWHRAGFRATGVSGLDEGVATVIMAYHPIAGTH